MFKTQKRCQLLCGHAIIDQNCTLKNNNKRKHQLKLFAILLFINLFRIVKFQSFNLKFCGFSIITYIGENTLNYYIFNNDR